jgi:hypothetical protein
MDFYLYLAIAHIVFLISIGSAIFSFGFLIWALVSNARKGWLTLGELMIYVAVAGLIIAILTCFRLNTLSYGQTRFVFPEPAWLHLGLYYLLLIPCLTRRPFFVTFAMWLQG